MSNLRGHVVFAVIVSAAAAAVTDLRPPSLEDTVSFITAAVRQHQAGPALFADERRWRLAIAFAGCSVEMRVSSEVNRLGAWSARTRIARWRLQDIDDAAVQVIDERGVAPGAFVVELPCEDRRACVDRAADGRDDAVQLAFTSTLMAQRVAAAFRYGTTLCRARPDSGDRSR